MSGYLRRLVERHAADPAARPRALSRFETGLSPFRETTGEAVSPPPAEDAPAEPFRRGTVPSFGPVSKPEAPRDALEGSLPAVAATPARLPSERAAAPSPERRGRTAPDRPFSPPAPIAAPAHGLTPPARRPDASPLPQVAGTVFPRMAPVAANARPPVAAPLRGAPDRTVREPDVVRVQIGRVEVRAVLPPAARPTTPSRPAEGPLSLDRYLARGERP